MKRSPQIPPDMPIPSPFSQLVLMLASSTLQQLGKIINPLTQRAEVDLEGAQATIDLLDVLKEKTRGNLDAQEQHILDEALMSLKLNFVETQKSAPATPSAPEPAPAPAQPRAEPAAATPPPPPAGKPGTGPDDKTPRYHKTYG